MISEEHGPEQEEVAPGGFFSIVTLAQLMGCSTQQFLKRYRPLVRGLNAERKGHKGKLYLHGPTYLQALREDWRRADAAAVAGRQKATPAAEEDMRFRRIKTEREELKLKAELREWIPIAEIRDAFDQIASVLSGFGETLRTPPQGNPELHQKWLRTWDHCGEVLDRLEDEGKGDETGNREPN